MDIEIRDNQDAAALLEWQVSMGADEAIADETIDRFNSEIVAETATKTPPKAAKKTASRPMPVAARPAQPTSGAGVQAALDAANACNTVDALKQALENFDGGLLKRSAKNTVFSDGTVGAPLMVMGDIPGAEEDTLGKPFVGAPGQLLDKMLAAISLSRTDGAYLTDLVPWRPLGNSKPDAAILDMCKAFAARHILLAKPKVLILLGGTTAKTILGNDDSISRQRGKWKSLPPQADNAGTDIAVMAMVHPSFLLNQPLQKKNAWHDLLAVQEKLSS
ncbi:MAG: uracil-DNA glycosylase [Kordiimonadaceae bacterium]|nr:uracil-DNA glycosylase [Kordiimonadaceae bacterium]